MVGEEVLPQKLAKLAIA